VITFLLVLSTFASGTIHRCGLESLPPGWKPSAPPAAEGAAASQTAAARSLAVSVGTLQTAHFVLWWTNGSVGIDTIHGAAPRAIPAGDSVPALVRTAATSLESAWHLYVDSMGYLAPKAAYQGYHWRKTPPKGKYPVEICQIDSAYFKATDASYFGLTIPYSDGSSSMLLASDLHDFGQWSYDRDVDRGAQGSDYSVDWANVIGATSAHEEFHAVQFNYETNLGHFLFESSAVAMEKVSVPSESDYLAFANANSNGICTLANLTPLLSASGSSSYPHAWYVKQIVGDYGRDILRKLWESRKGSSAPIKTTLRTVLGKYNSTFDTTLGRYALRLGLSGRRTDWLLPSFASFSDGDLFPTLSGTLPKATTARKVTLDSGAIQEWIDTLGNASDRIVDWIPDAGAGLGHAWKNGATNGSEWLRGSIRQSASLSRQDVWAVFNPGPQSALAGSATSESSRSWLWTSAAPARTTAKSGQNLAWTDPAGGATLSGTPTSDASCTPILHTDIWTPVQAEDPFAFSISGKTGGHAFVLEDADRVLKLNGTVLTMPFGSLGTVWIGRGDGVWAKTPSAPSASTTAIALDSLDLSLPLRILAAPGASPILPQIMARSPYPNPSRLGSSILFPLSGIPEGAELVIVAADGTSVRRLEAPAGKTMAVWDIRNSSGRRVRPGVYWYLWRGVAGSVRGELLIAD
jgi:hypothetical protein